MALADASPGTQRVISAVILAPLPLAAIWYGGAYLAVLTALAAAVMAWEWARLCGGGRVAPSGLVLIGAALAAVAAAALWGLAAGLAAAFAGAALAYALTRRLRALGVLWIALPCVVLLWLAEACGRATVLWLFAVVWATDIGAYEIGRRVGGRRLAPRWSPGKTWAGLVGGTGCAALAGWAAAQLLAVAPAWPLILASAGLAIVEQFGDLAESVAKRRFGVKDSGGLIPGHGGLLDRLDGLLAAIPAAALLSLCGGGVATWR